MTDVLEHGGERDERPDREAAEAPRQLHRPFVDVLPGPDRRACAGKLRGGAGVLARAVEHPTAVQAAARVRREGHAAVEAVDLVRGPCAFDSLHRRRWY